MRTRFAPSPTGDLHLGGTYVALASWWLARAHGGQLVLRVEDIDTPRVVAGSTVRILEDLAWLGLAWDEGPYSQSERASLYEGAIAMLSARGLVYPCDCSRAEIARVASAPHAGEDVVYPGTCRDRDPTREMKREPALRLRVPANETVTVHDEVAGIIEQRLDVSVGDFVLKRGDGIYAYQLAVVVDDLEMKISDVVRGADLLASTPRQVFLASLLGHEAPRYHHLPLVLDSQGERLAKRTPGAHVRALRERGVLAETIVGELAYALGLLEKPVGITPSELVTKSQVQRLSPRGNFRIPKRWATER